MAQFHEKNNFDLNNKFFFQFLKKNFNTINKLRLAVFAHFDEKNTGMC